MKVLVIYDTVFGNTEQVAKAIGEALGANEEVTTLQVNTIKVEQLREFEVLIVGSPTRSFMPTKDITAFLDKIPRDGLKSVKVAAFDTRVEIGEVKSRLLKAVAGVFGYAAKPILDGLVRVGGVPMAPPEGFIVRGREGPLRDGELGRAAAWEKMLIKK